MHDDSRRRALESKKTVSRKAQTKQPSVTSSRNSSPATSRNASRAASRNPSDDESEMSDGTAWSTTSINDDAAFTAEDEVAPETLQGIIDTTVNDIVDRKRSSAEGREDRLNYFIHVLMANYAQQELHSKSGDLVPASIKSVKAGQTERETISAMKASALVLITSPSDSIYDAVSNPFRHIISDSQEMNAKVAAIHALGAATFYGGASSDETQNVMDFYSEIVESDGESIEAGDHAEIVTAALEEWGFLATQMDEMEDTVEEPMEAFVEQLDSSDVHVQIAAGENIALMFEKSYTEREDDEEPEEHDEDEEEDPTAVNMVKRYTVYRRVDQLEHKSSALSSASSKRMSKKDRKSSHTNFADILNSVEHPTRGPRYSNAIDQDTGKPYGSRMTVGISGKSRVIIDKWWKLHRLKALRRVLQGGFLTHYEKNEVVFDTSPVMLEED